MTGVVVGADLGSSSARAVAVDPDGVLRGVATCAYEGSATWPPGRADPAALLHALDTALRRLAAQLPATRRPAALAVGGQSPTTVPRDGGLAVTCLHPAGATGKPDDQHLAQLDVLRVEHGDDVVPMQLWDWVLWRLGAPGSQGRWPGDAELSGYGSIVPTGSAAGESDGTSVEAGTPLVPGAQDAYLGFWAAGIDRPGRALDPGGRTGGLGVAVGAGARPAHLFALASAATGVDIVGGPTSAHGLLLDWWAGLSGRPLQELLELAASVAPGSHGVLALPYLEGERAPRWNRDLCAELVGLRSSTGPGEVTRAFLEATAYGLAHIAAELGACGITTDVLVVGGSPARSDLWCTIKASILEVPVEIPEHPDLAAYGAALAAGAAVGWWPAPRHGGSGDWPRPPMRVIEPEPSDVYRSGFRRFVELGDAALRRLAERETPL